MSFQVLQCPLGLLSKLDFHLASSSVWNTPPHSPSLLDDSDASYRSKNCFLPQSKSDSSNQTTAEFLALFYFSFTAIIIVWVIFVPCSVFSLDCKLLEGGEHLFLIIINAVSGRTSGPRLNHCSLLNYKNSFLYFALFP